MSARIFDDNSLSIGRTPLVRIRRMAGGLDATVLAKIEGRNPAYSVKCRVGAALIWDAEKRGVLRPGMRIVEPTSGNTGIALAFVGASRGYRVSLVMPDSFSLERRRLMAAFGAELILTPGQRGMSGAVQRAEEIAAADPKGTFLPDQFRNPANPAIHEATTGPEIWEDTDGVVDAVVAGVGTGGTLTGIARYLKKTSGKPVLSVAVEPDECALISQKLAGQPLHPGMHKIQGIGASFIPENLDFSVLDRVERVTGAEAMATARDLAAKEGILAGISSGAAMAAALRLAAEPANRGKTIVAILPDSGERYLSTPLWEGLGE